MQVTGVPAVIDEAVAIDASSEVIEVDAESCGGRPFRRPGEREADGLKGVRRFFAGHTSHVPGTPCLSAL
jgi:hypothetical protein